jgi:hypothetical protein
MNVNQPWYLTIKISDDLGKHMGNNEEFNHACYELHIPISLNHGDPKGEPGEDGSKFINK